MDINIPILTKALIEEYGFSQPALTAAPRGFVAETYYVDTENGRYFAKLVKVVPHAETPEHSLPTLRELHRMGIMNITYPIETVDGQLFVTVGDKMLAVFNRIDGQWVFDFPLEPYVKLLATVHQLSNRIESPLPTEQFGLPFRDDVLAGLERLWNEDFEHPQERALVDWAKERHKTLERDFVVLEATARELRSRNIPYVVTHGDAAGNVLVEGDLVYVVDWDTIRLAPRERDTWFHLRTPGFLALYRAHVPGYEFDMDIYRFYLYRRYFDDLWGFVDKIFSPELSDADKAHNLSELVKTCDEWLQPLMESDWAGYRSR